MKKAFLLILIALTTISTQAHANNQQKVALIKKAYQEANQGIDWVTIFMKYGDKSLKNHIQNREYCEADAMWDNQDPQYPTKVTVSMAKNGQVKATFKQYGSHSTVYYDVTCQGNTCKIKNSSAYSCE